MLLGGLFETLLEPALDGAWTIAPVGLAGGSFLFLGLHAVHTEWKRRGAVPAFLAACSGAAIAAVLQHAFGGSRF
jgi:hypothetical protein